MLTNATPREIDAKLAELYDGIAKAERQAALCQKTLDGIAAGHRYCLGTQERAEAGLAKAKAEAEEARKAAEPFHAEYGRRPWSRFFLVTSSQGHVHSSTRCSTCNPHTAFAWLPELSGKSEAEAVEQYGDAMCTVCFPSAPTHPAFIRSAQERAAAEAKKQAAYCDASPYAYDAKPGALYVRCKGCGYVGKPSPRGALRKHRPPKGRK